jgi:hypothetical protein
MLPIGQEAGWAPELVLMLWRREKSPSPARNRTSAHRPSLIDWQHKKTADLMISACIIERDISGIQ